MADLNQVQKNETDAPADKKTDDGLKELLRQADALLEEHSTKDNQSDIEKPTLPKKEAKLRTKGRSFDIIQSTPGAKRSRALLKTGFRANETPRLLRPETPQTDRPTLSRSEQPDQGNDTRDFAPTQTTESAVTEQNKVTTPIPSQPEEKVTSERGELYPSNLVKDAKPKGYTPHPKQHNPIVFDTNEYHTSLHDWSPDEVKHGVNKLWVMAAVFGTVLVCGLIYVLFVN